MSQGWIKIHRKITDWGWYADGNTFRVFLHLLLTCNHEKKQWQGIDVDAGQTVTSVSKLSQQLGISPMQIRTCLKRLKSTNEITIQTTSRFTLLSICKWGDYQLNFLDDNKPNNKPNNKRITNEQQTDNKRITTNKNDNNDKNEEEEEEYMPPENSDFLDDQFDPISEPPPKEKSCAKKEKVNFRAKLIEIGVTEQTADDWLQVRKMKRAANTQRAMEKILKELRMAWKDGLTPEDCILRAVTSSWAGFEYEWIKNKTQHGQQQKPNSKGTTDAELMQAVMAGLDRAEANRRAREGQ